MIFAAVLVASVGIAAGIAYIAGAYKATDDMANYLSDLGEFEDEELL